MDQKMAEALFENQMLLSEAITDTRQEIGEAAMTIAQDMDELILLIYGTDEEIQEGKINGGLTIRKLENPIKRLKRSGRREASYARSSDSFLRNTAHDYRRPTKHELERARSKFKRPNPIVES